MSDAIDSAAARLYGLLPAHIRTRDAEGGQRLLAYLRALAAGAVVLDAETDRLLDNFFVETADALGLENLGRLVGAETLAELPPGAPFSMRAFIANTVRYRRAKGTPRALEGLAADVGVPGAVVVEYFQRLVCTAALIDLRPERPGLAPLTDGDTGARVGTAFDLLTRVADLRSIARAGGRHGIPNVGVHVVRWLSLQYPAAPGDTVSIKALAGVPQLLPWRDSGGAHVDGYFQLSPFQGHRLPLVNPDRRAENGTARAKAETRVDRLRRLPIHREVEARRAALVKGLSPAAARWFNATGEPFALYVLGLNKTAFRRVPLEQIGICNLSTMLAGHPRPSATRAYAWREAGKPAPIARTGTATIAAAIDPATGRVLIAAPASPADEIVEVRVAHAYGQGDELGAGPHERNDASVPFDIAMSDFLRVVDPTVAAGSEFVSSLAAALIDWANETKARRGFIVLACCDVENPTAPLAVAMRGETELHIVAAQWRPKKTPPGVADVTTRRGYIVRRGCRFALTKPLRVVAGPSPPGTRPGALVLDGLALAGGIVLAAKALTELRLRHVTVRAGAAPALGLEAPASALTIRVERSIVGAMSISTPGGLGDGNLFIERSIVTTEGGSASIDAGGLDAKLTNVTLFGSSKFKSLEATGVIFASPVEVTRRQAGCMRYCYIAENSKAPRRFRCQPDLAIAERRRLHGGAQLSPNEQAGIRLGVVPIFLDTDADEPTLALLSPRCATEIRRGGEGGTEMGAFAATGEPMRLGNITTLFDDYLPVALEGAVLDDTRDAASTNLRSLP